MRYLIFIIFTSISVIHPAVVHVEPFQTIDGHNDADIIRELIDQVDSVSLKNSIGEIERRSISPPPIR